MKYVGLIDNSKRQQLTRNLEQAEFFENSNYELIKFKTIEDAQKSTKNITALFVRTKMHKDVEDIELAKSNGYLDKNLFAVTNTLHYISDINCPANSHKNVKDSLFAPNGEYTRLQKAGAIIVHRNTSTDSLNRILERYIR